MNQTENLKIFVISLSVAFQLLFGVTKLPINLAIIDLSAKIAACSTIGYNIQKLLTTLIVNNNA